MESGRVLPLFEAQTEAVLAKLASMKELMQHSVNQSMPFYHWINQASKDEKLVLQTFSKRLLHIFFQDNPFYQFGESYEDELLELHGSLKRLLKKFNQAEARLSVLQSLMKFVHPYYPCSEIDDKIKNVKDYINIKSINSDIIVEDRETRVLDLIDDYSCQYVHGDSGDTVLKRAFASLIYKHQVLLDLITIYVAPGVEVGGISPTKYELVRVIELLQKLKNNSAQFGKYFTVFELKQADINQEEVILIKTALTSFCKVIGEVKQLFKKTLDCLSIVSTLKEWQQAINTFVCGDDKLLLAFINRYSSSVGQAPLVIYLHENLGKLKTAQYKFFDFLHRKRRMGLFESTAALDQCYERLFKRYTTCETHSKYRELLSSALFAAKQLHVPCLMLSGNMILNGHGCVANADAATKFFLSALLLARTNKDKEVAKKSLLISLQIVPSVEDVDIFDSDICLEIEVVLKVLESSDGLLNKMGDHCIAKLSEITELFLEFYHDQINRDSGCQRLCFKYIELASNGIEKALTISEEHKDSPQMKQMKKRIADKLICIIPLIKRESEMQKVNKMFERLKICIPSIQNQRSLPLMKSVSGE